MNWGLIDLLVAAGTVMVDDGSHCCCAFPLTDCDMVGLWTSGEQPCISSHFQLGHAQSD